VGSIRNAVYACAVAGGGGPAGSHHSGTDDLLQLAVSRPRDAIVGAYRVLAARPDPYEASIAHQAVGIVHRDNGDIDTGIRDLRGALRLARRAGSADREADVLSSLGAALVYAGRTTQGLAAVERAVRLASDSLLGRVLYRRASMLWTLTRYGPALEDLRHAVRLLEQAGDLVWTARALNTRGLVHLSAGSPSQADADFAAAGQLLAQAGEDLGSIHALLNRGLAAFRSGELPTALLYLEEAAARYRALDVPAPELSRARCTVLRAAGLTSDALAEADAAIREIERANGWSTKRAELLLTAADCALATDQPQIAIARAEAARRLFRSQQRDRLLGHARLIIAQARYEIGAASGRLLADASRAAVRLEELGSREAIQAHLLAGRIALDLDRRADAQRHLLAVSRTRQRGSAIARASGWLGAALLAQADRDDRRMLAACRRGLQVLDEHRWTLGASELRAQATAHGTELATIAVRYAANAGRPRLLLGWAERWRATAVTAVPAVRPPADPELNADLAMLRTVTLRLDQAREQGRPTAALQREQLRLEGAVRSRSLLARGTAAAAGGGVDNEELLDRLRDAQLVEIVDVDGILHVLVCAAGRVRQFRGGVTAEAVRAAEYAGFALRRLARDRPRSDPASTLAILSAAGPRLEAALLGPAAGQLGDGAVVVVPPGKLHGIPWALLPALGSRVFSVVPSAAAWLRARTAQPPARRHVTLACGPGLTTDGAEIPQVAKLYGDVTVLSGAQATAGNVLSALDGAWLGHVAAHGSFRADSPLFSSLRMHDGPLTVYDFEQLGRAPYRLVLSSCDSGVLAPVGADELLGLVASLLPLGTAGIVAGVVQLNDRAVVPLMVQLHQHLQAGRGLAESMYSVRRGATADPVEHAAAMSLLALGAG
jgi:tetratricopeptide (TPR) repeat protein